MKSLFTAAAAIAMAAAVPTAPALAQDAAAVSPGMEVVYAEDMTSVGSITAVKDGTIVINTGKHEVAIPADRVTPHEGKVLFGMSQADLNAAVEADLAKAQQAIVPGAAVFGSAGTQIGTLEEIDDQFATIKLTGGTEIKVPRSGTAPSPNGLVVGLTAADIEAQTAANQAANAAEDAADAAEQAADAAEKSAEAAAEASGGGL